MDVHLATAHLHAQVALLHHPVHGVAVVLHVQTDRCAPAQVVPMIGPVDDVLSKGIILELAIVSSSLFCSVYPGFRAYRVLRTCRLCLLFHALLPRELALCQKTLLPHPLRILWRRRSFGVLLVDWEM